MASLISACFPFFLPRLTIDVNAVSLKHLVTEPRPSVRIVVEGENIRAMLDTGSQVSLISKSKFSMLGVGLRPHRDSLNLKRVNGETVEFIGVAKIKVRLGKWKRSHYFVVVPDDACPQEALLGEDFLKQFRTITYKCDGKRVFIEGETIRLVR